MAGYSHVCVQTLETNYRQAAAGAVTTGDNRHSFRRTDTGTSQPLRVKCDSKLEKKRQKLRSETKIVAIEKFVNSKMKSVLTLRLLCRAETEQKDVKNKGSPSCSSTCGSGKVYESPSMASPYIRELK